MLLRIETVRDPAVAVSCVPLSVNLISTRLLPTLDSSKFHLWSVLRASFHSVFPDLRRQDTFYCSAAITNVTKTSPEVMMGFGACRTCSSHYDGTVYNIT